MFLKWSCYQQAALLVDKVLMISDSPFERCPAMKKIQANEKANNIKIKKPKGRITVVLDGKCQPIEQSSFGDWVEILVIRAIFPKEFTDIISKTFVWPQRRHFQMHLVSHQLHHGQIEGDHIKCLRTVHLQHCRL